MTTIEFFYSQSIMQALGWTLLHFVWQGALIALLLAAALAILSRRSATLHYAVACGAMVLMLSTPLATFWLLLASPKEEAPAHVTDLKDRAIRQVEMGRGGTTAIETDRQPAWQIRMASRISPYLSWVISVWLGSVFVLTLRLVVSWKCAHNRKDRGTRPIEARYQETLAEIQRQLRVSRPVALLESTIAQVPMVIGWLRPVLLIPTGVLTGLTQEQLRAIIAHELAHIHRHDYLVNLLQSVVETLLFYHPAVWWVSRLIRDEREHCCDDIAIKVQCDALTYARALTRLESLRSDQPGIAVAATGRSLLCRIQRLVQDQGRRPNRISMCPAGVIVLCLLVTTGSGMGGSLLYKTVDLQQESQVKYAPGTPEEKAAEAMDLIIKTLKGRSFELDGRVSEALEQIKASGSIEPVLAALKNHDGQTREKAAWVLGNLEDARAVELLIVTLEDGDWRGQHTVAWALGMIRDARAVEPLIRGVKTGNPDVRQASAWSLGMIGDSRAVEPLIDQLKHQSSDVRHGAAWALGLIGDKRAIEPLRTILRDPDLEVRAVVSQSLARLANR